MTQNRQSRSNTRMTERDWNEYPNRNNDQGYRSQGGSHEDDTQRNAQGSSPRWNNTSGFQGDTDASGYRDNNSYDRGSNYFGRNDYGPGNNYDPNEQRRDWQDQGRSFGNQDSYRNERWNQDSGFDDDRRYGNRSNDYSSRSMYSNDYGQGQYGSQMGRNYSQRGQQNSGFSERDNYTNGMNQGTGSSNRDGNSYATGVNYGGGNWGAGSYGSGNSGSWGNNDNSMGVNREGYLAGKHKGKGPKGYSRSDDRIKEDISDRLSDDSHIDASDIEVEVSNGVVSLSGTVESREIKRRAEDMVESISGVSNVENRLRVGKEDTGERTSSSSDSKGSSGKTSNSTSNTNSEKNKRNSLANSYS